MSEGGEARNHEAEIEAVARAIAGWDPFSSAQVVAYERAAAIRAIRAFDAVRRSPKGEDHEARRFWCPECAATEIHHDWCSMAPGQPVTSGNREPPPSPVSGTEPRWIEPHDALKYELGDPMDDERVSGTEPDTAEKIAAWLQHIDRLDEIPGARVGLPNFNPLWDAAEAIRVKFAAGFSVDAGKPGEGR